MIIKSKGRRSKTGIKQLLEYILRPEALFHDGSGRTLLVKNNLRGMNIDEWCREYAINETYRVHKKRNTNAVYHEILAFHELDTDKITLEVLEKIAREYIRQRNPNALAVATAHIDRPHIHIHFAISGVEFRSGASLRVSRQLFNEMKIHMEQYQEREFPEMIHSLVDFGKKKA